MSENIVERNFAPEALSRPYNAAAAAIPAVSLEFVFYALLFAFAAALRLFSLDGTPTLSEVPNLLAAWHGNASANPTLLWVQAISFDLLGSSLLAARLLTAVAGIFLAFSPAMFREELGRTRALALTLLLVVAAPMVISARESAPVIWTALFAAIALRLWLNHFYAPEAGRGMRAIIATAALLLLGDPSGVIFALALSGGAALALLWRAATADSDTEAVSGLSAARTAFSQIAWEKSILVAALVVVAVASGFMIAPSGLSSIGSLLHGITTLTQPDGDNVLSISLYYQLFLWLLAFAALLKNRQQGWNAPDRFFIGWLVIALLAVALLPGLHAQHTLLLVFPLCGLAANHIVYAFVPDKRQQILSEQYSADGDELAMLTSPPAGRFILMLVVFALLFIFNVHLGTTMREFLQVESSDLGGALGRIEQNIAGPDFRIGLLWSFISAMFVAVGFFLAGSIWGNRVAGQGYTLGFVLMLIVTQLSGGWYASSFYADNAVEPWHHEAVTQAYNDLAQSLSDLNFREAQGFARLPITVLRNSATGMTEDGLMGWMLRDFDRVYWVDNEIEARTAPIIIAPEIVLDEGMQRDLGGSYVGQSFVLTRSWSPETLVGFDFMTWYLQRNVRVQPAPLQAAVLWVRQDVFDNRPIQDLLD